MHYMYRHLSATGALLYVGITRDLDQRWSQHATESPWFSEIANVSSESFETREAAMLAEQEAIRAERPLHNIENRRSLSELSPAGRQRARRERMRKDGYTLKHVWVHKDNEYSFDSFVHSLETGACGKN